MLLVWFCLHFYALLSLLEYDERRGRSGTTSRTFASSRRKRPTPCLRLAFTTQTEGEEKLAISFLCQSSSHWRPAIGLRESAQAREVAGRRTLQPPRDLHRPHPLLLPNSANPDYFRGLGVAEGLTPGVAVGLASGVAVGIAVGDGSGIAPGVERPVMSGVGAGCGVTRRIPDGVPGAASRSPLGVASVEPFLFGAGPVVDGAVVDAPVWLAPPL